MQRRCWWLAAAVLLAVCARLVFPVPAAGAEKGRVVILLVDKLTTGDLANGKMPVLAKLAGDGGLGLVNTRTAGKGEAEDGCLTIGAGAPVDNNRLPVLAFNREENYIASGRKAELSYQGFTGYSADESRIVVVNLPELVQINQTRNTTGSVPGRLGTELHRAGLKTCVLGNGDSFGVHRRSGAALVMDDRGRVDFGDVSREVLRLDYSGATDYETDFEVIGRLLQANLSRADVIVVDIPDLSRLDQPQRFYPSALESVRSQILSEIDAFTAFTASRIDPSRDLLMVFSPSPAAAQREAKNTFSPMVIWGGGVEGTLTSAGTKREMIVSNLDIAPTILNHFGIGSLEFRGRPAEGRKFTGSAEVKLQKIILENDKVSRINRLRAPIVKGYVGVQIVVLVLGLLSILRERRLVGLSRYLIILILVTPLIFLIASPVSNFSASFLVAFIVLGALAVSWGVSILMRRNNIAILGLVALITIAVLDIDTLLGGGMLHYCVMGYDPMAGARYYGIGNEYMGVLLGCTILLAAVLFELMPRRLAGPLALVLFAVELVFIGSPALGTNAGGTIACSFGFLLAALLLYGFKPTLRLVLGGLAAALAVVAGVAFIDLHRSPELQTHIGRTATQIAQGGWMAAWDVIYRKLAMNAKLIRFTIWSRVFIGALITMVVFLFNPKGIMGFLYERYPFLVKGMIGSVFGAFAALAFNDSGIVAAATASIFSVFPLLYLALDARNGSSEQEKLYRVARLARI